MSKRLKIAAVLALAALPCAFAQEYFDPPPPRPVVTVSDCVRDFNLDFWAESDVTFAHKLLGRVFEQAGMDVLHAPFDEDGMFDPSAAEVVCSTFRTEAMTELYDFPIQPIGMMHFALYTTAEKASRMLSLKISDWPRLRVAYSPVSLGFTDDREKYFSHAGLSPEYVQYSTSVAAVDALKNDDVDALFLYTPFGKRPKGIVEIVPIGDRNVYFAVRKDRPDLFKVLSSVYREYYIDCIDEIDGLKEKYLGVQKPKKRVRIAAYQRGDLFEVSPDGVRSGLIEEWVKALCAYSKRTADFVYGGYEESLEAVKSGRLDVVGGIGFTPMHRESLLYPHTPIGMLRVYLWAHPDSPYEPGNPASWRGMKVGILAGTQSAARIKQQLARHEVDLKCIEFHSDRELTDAYFSGVVDACVNVEKSELANERALHVYVSHPMYICTAPDRLELFDELESVLDAICYDFPRYMRMGSEKHYGTRSGEAEYTLNEAEWLRKRIKSGESVKIDLSPWPYNIFDERGELQGFTKLLFDVLSRDTGLKFEVLPPSDLQSAEAKFLRGETDFWVPYPEKPEYAVIGATPVFSLAVPESFAETVGAKDMLSEFVMYAGVNAPDELIGILRKTIASIESSDFLEMFMEAVSRRKMIHRVFGLTAEEIGRLVIIVGSLLALVVIVYGVVMIILLKRHARRAEEAAQAAEEHAQAKTRFLAMMSHELRTPLNAVIGFAEFIGRSSNVDEKTKEYVEGILVSSNALLALINDILDLSKLEAKSMKMLVGTCDVNRLLNELPAIFGYRVKKSGVSLKVESSGNIPVVRLSHQGMRQVLINVVGNSVKFTEKGEIAVSASWIEATGTLRISVSDTGCGISKDKLNKLFNPFEQDLLSRMNNSKNGEFKGTGLGLPIVKRMVESANGTVKVSSVLGKGTTLTIEIPGLKVAEDHLNVNDRPSEHGHRELPGRVLVVDDMQMNRKILGIHLGNIGIKDVRYAANGKEALEVMADWIPDMVLTDMWMPEMDGTRLAEKMRADSRFAKVSIVAITADVDVGATYDMSLFAKVLSKPVTSEKLREIF